MTRLEQLASAQQDGVGILREIWAAQYSKQQLADILDMTVSDAGSLRHAAHQLFAPLPDPKQAAIRDETTRLLEEKRVSLSRIRVMTSAVGQLNSRATITKEEFRRRLADLALTHTADRLKSLALDLAREANADCGPDRSRRGLFVAKNADAAGMRRAQLVLEDAAMRTLQTALHTAAIDLRRNSTTLSYPQALADALLDTVSRPSVGRRLPLEVAIIVTTDDLRGGRYATSLKRDSDHHSYLFQLSDGSALTAEELLSYELSPHGWVLLEHDGTPVDLWRTNRFANDKQRRITNLHQVICAHPDCDRPTSLGHYHHLQAWAAGGPTNLDNLVGLCAEHNRLNDDNPSRAKYGHAIRGPDGAPGWQPPDSNQPPRYNQHPAAARSAGAWARNKRRARQEKETRE